MSKHFLKILNTARGQWFVSWWSRARTVQWRHCSWWLRAGLLPLRSPVMRFLHLLCCHWVKLMHHGRCIHGVKTVKSGLMMARGNPLFATQFFHVTSLELGCDSLTNPLMSTQWAQDSLTLLIAFFCPCIYKTIVITLLQFISSYILIIKTWRRQ